MKVNELIEQLKLCPPDARVVAPGYEEGLDDVIDVQDVFIKPNANTDVWYKGLHSRIEHHEPGGEKAVELKTSRR